MTDNIDPSKLGTDAHKWAKEFVYFFYQSAPGPAPTSEVFKAHEEFAVTWFANAIETARDVGRVDGDEYGRRGEYVRLGSGAFEDEVQRRFRSLHYSPPTEDAQEWAHEFGKAMADYIHSASSEKTKSLAEFIEDKAGEWFTRAMEAAVEGSDRDLKEDAAESTQLTKAERAIAALRECADALEDMPFRMQVMRGLFGQIPVNNPDLLRQEAEFISSQMDMTAAATAPPTSKEG